MEKITIVGVDCGGSHGCGLSVGLRKYAHVTTVWKNRNRHGLDYIEPMAKFGFEHIPDRGDILIIISSVTYNKLVRDLGYRFDKILHGYKKVKIIIGDGKIMHDPELYNEKFKDFEVFCHICKIHFRGDYPTKIYYQPFDLSHVDQTKNKVLTIAHSPFVKLKTREKGTGEIIKIVKELGIEFDLITDVSWKECMRRKAKAHIFVDQIDHYNRDNFKFNDPDYIWPALGKSGLEAMHLGCLVITYGKGYDTDIPAPPVAWCRGNFKEVLDYYIKNEKERTKLAAKGKAWALKYASYDFAAKNVLNESI